MADEKMGNEDEYEGSMEQMLVENSLLLHAAVNMLIRKGILDREELDAEIDRLYEEIEEGEEEGE